GAGGAASNIQVNNHLFTAAPWNPGAPNPSGPIFNGSTENEVFTRAAGGNGTAGAGGDGATVQIYGGAGTTNTDAIIVRGGNGATGGSGGAIALLNMDLVAGGTPPLPDPDAGVSNSAQLFADGGNGTAGAGGA